MSEHKQKPLSHRAFTLVELLVVVAILALLSVIAVPNFQEAVRRSNRAACASNLKALASALALYKVDYNRFPLGDGTAGPYSTPGRTELGNGPAAAGSWAGAPRILVELGYLSSDAALFCPALRKRHRGREQNFRYAYNSSAADTFGHDGGDVNIDRESGDFWLARCVWVPHEKSFHPEFDYQYPHGDYQIAPDCVDNGCMENALMSDLRVIFRNGRQDFYKSYGLSYPPAH